MAVNKVVYQTVPKNDKILVDESSPNYAVAPKGFGVRHLQALLLFLSLAIGMAIRTAISVLMVAMIDIHKSDCNKTLIRNSTKTTDVDCQNVQSTGSVYQTYDWNKSKQEIIMFAFFVGYTSMQIPMGLISQKVGGKIPLMVALGVSGISSICMPWIPLIGGWISVSICRFVQGMTQAAFYPCMHTMLGKWSPLSERGRLCSYIYSGSQIGTIFAFQLSGLFAGTPALGWPAAFWMFGALGLLACGLLGWLGASSPHEHSRISAEEFMFVTESSYTDVVPKKRKAPWREIIKCRAVWGLITTQAGSTIGYILVLTEIPLYMNAVLGVDIKRNGVYSSLPYIAMSVMVWIFGYLADFATNRKIMTVVNIRRTANTIGMAVSALFLIAFSFVSNTVMAVCLLVTSLGSHSGVQLGFLVNQIDLAPNFAGSIMALGNMIGVISSLIVPVIVSNIVTDVTNHKQWQIVFVIVALIQIVTNAIYVIFAKADVQPWNFYGDDEYDILTARLSFAIMAAAEFLKFWINENSKELKILQEKKCDVKSDIQKKEDKL